MNNIQLKIQIQNLSKFESSDGGLLIKGKCQFFFYDRGEIHSKSLNYEAQGKRALHVLKYGIGSTHVVSGKLNIYKIQDALNPKIVLKIEQAFLLEEIKTSIAPMLNVRQENNKELVNTAANQLPNPEVNDLDPDDISF